MGLIMGIIRLENITRIIKIKAVAKAPLYSYFNMIAITYYELSKDIKICNLERM